MLHDITPADVACSNPLYMDNLSFIGTENEDYYTMYEFYRQYGMSTMNQSNVNLLSLIRSLDEELQDVAEIQR